ncbi:MAG: hypothetical protein Q9170_008196, partial [Blastenia crenularia]
MTKLDWNEFVNNDKMSIDSKRHRPKVQIFEDGPVPATKQLTFSHRRHSSSRRKPTVTPATTWKQPTLTQITPSLFHASSTSGSFDGANDLEYDILETAMPPKKRRRSSSKPSRPSKPTVGQQTITQMEPFNEQLYPVEDGMDLEEEQAPATDPLPRRKKRKTTSLTPVVSTVQTRSSRRKSANTGTETEKMEPSRNQQTSVIDDDDASSLPQNRALQMAHPQTPQRTRKKVIPSSQSPSETPLSTRVRRNKKDQRVTPLAERSVNTPSKSRLLSRRKFVQWVPKLEIADSTNLEDENDELLNSPIISNIRAKSPAKVPSITQQQEPLGQLTLCSTPKTFRHFDKSVSGALNTIGRRSASKIVKRKETIADSEDENNSSPSRNPEKVHKPQRQNFILGRPIVNNTENVDPPSPPSRQNFSIKSNEALPQDERRQASSFET